MPSKQNWTLSQNEAQQLLNEMKNAVEREFIMPAPGEHNKEFHVTGRNSGTDYTIAPFRGKRNPSKHSISARISRTGTQLIRLCVNGSPHSNPDGSVIQGSHMHVYREGYDARIAYAVNIQSPDFVEDTILLLDKFHVISQPAFQDGIEVGI